MRPGSARRCRPESRTSTTTAQPSAMPCQVAGRAGSPTSSSAALSGRPRVPLRTSARRRRGRRRALMWRHSLQIPPCSARRCRCPPPLESSCCPARRGPRSPRRCPKPRSNRASPTLAATQILEGWCSATALRNRLPLETQRRRCARSDICSYLSCPRCRLSARPLPSQGSARLLRPSLCHCGWRAPWRALNRPRWRTRCSHASPSCVRRPRTLPTR